MAEARNSWCACKVRKKAKNYETTDNGGGGSSAHSRSQTERIEDDARSRFSKGENRKQTREGGEKPDSTGQLELGQLARPQQQEGRGVQGEQVRGQQQTREEQAHRGEQGLSDLEAWTQRVEALEQRVAHRVAARLQAASDALNKDKKSEGEPALEETGKEKGPEYGSLNQDAIVNCLEKMAIISQHAENETEEQGFELRKEAVQDILLVLEEWTKEAAKMNVDPKTCNSTIQANALLRAMNNCLSREGARPKADDEPPLSEIIKAAKEHLQRHQ